MGKVLVTGASGYIGAVMVPMLVDAGHEVTTLDIGLYARSGFDPGIPSPDGRDVRDATVEDFAGHDAVIALAALSNDPLGNLDPQVTYEINHRAVVRNATRAKEAGVKRFLFASSCSLYGAAGGDLVDETAGFAPVTAYGRSKVLAESELAALADDDFSPVYLRNATVYGVSPALRLDIVVNNLTAWAIATDRIVLQSDGTPWRPQVHIEDVARAFIAVLEAPRELIHDQAFNVGRTEQNFQVRDIAEMVHDAIPDAVLEMPEVTDPDTRSYRVDFSKFASAFPDTPLEMDVARGIKELAAAFRDHDIVEASFDRYTRLREIERRIAAGEIDPSLRRAA
jgi:nucleoside-diphosphate-sugar epimerase